MDVFKIRITLGGRVVKLLSSGNKRLNGALTVEGEISGDCIWDYVATRDTEVAASKEIEPQLLLWTEDLGDGTAAKAQKAKVITVLSSCPVFGYWLLL